jgi:hypothetical protein
MMFANTILIIIFFLISEIIVRNLPVVIVSEKFLKNLVDKNLMGNQIAYYHVTTMQFL